ncbi:MAG: hypothetical protein ACXQS3_03190 [Candidatus Methanofastidiosia archaeon]
MKRTLQITIAAVFAALAFISRAYLPAIPIIPPIVFDFRGFFVFSGASLVSPPFALLIGLFSGIPAALPYVDMTAFGLAAVTVSILAIRLKWWAIPFGPVVGVLTAAIILDYNGLMPFKVAITALAPRVAINTALSIAFVWYMHKNKQISSMLELRHK